MCPQNEEKHKGCRKERSKERRDGEGGKVGDTPEKGKEIMKEKYGKN